MGNKQSGEDTASSRRQSAANTATRSPLDAITSTKDAQSTLEKKVEHMEKQILAERQSAKRLLMEKTNQAANKKRAQRHLLKARQLQAQIDKYQGMKDNLESVQVNLEMGAVTRNIHGAMRTANTAMKDMSKELDVDKMDDLMGDLTEGMQAMDEATNLMSQPINSDPLLDEEAENDLADLMQEMEMEEEEEVQVQVKQKKPAPKLPTAPSVTMPKAPTGKVDKTAEEEEDEEFAALRRAMN